MDSRTQTPTQGSPPVRILEPDGSASGDPDVGLSGAQLREVLRFMILARRLDRECVGLQRQGELTVYPGFEGQEAAQVGSAFALAPGDMAFPSFRELAAALVRGVDPVEYLQYHRGTWHGGPFDHVATGFAPICVPVASQICHAVGWALGAKLDRSNASAIAYFGDGAASEGDFHEAANLSGVWRAPIVLFCQNNGWAISVPVAQQSAGDIWRRAAGFGIAGVRVDGNDVLAVYRETSIALSRARRGDGPTLIEAVTYRIGPHSTADDAGRYRDDGDVERWRSLDPVDRFERYLLATRAADAAFIEGCRDAADARVREIREAISATPPPPVHHLFAWVFADPPRSLERQRLDVVGGGR
jgi:2-oxoisovalerate dehydrogenase E1 component alpha subunit